METETRHTNAPQAQKKWAHFGRGVGRFVFVGLAAGMGTVTILLIAALALGAGWMSFMGEFGVADPEHTSAIDCNVIALDLHGLMTTYRDDANGDGSYGTETTSGTLVAHLEEAVRDKSIKAVLLDIDTPGGYPQAAQEVGDAVRALGKPSVAWIRGSGDSAGYWVASAASTIVASPVSDVGSIGVTSSYTDVSKQNKDEGITYNSLSTGPFKDTGDPDKPLTEAERKYIEKQNQQVLDIFIKNVASWRNLPEETVRALADGSSFVGGEALERKLIDRLGTKPEALAALKDAIHEEPRLCWPQYQ